MMDAANPGSSDWFENANNLKRYIWSQMSLRYSRLNFLAKDLDLAASRFGVLFNSVELLSLAASALRLTSAVNKAALDIDRVNSAEFKNSAELHGMSEDINRATGVTAGVATEV